MKKGQTKLNRTITSLVPLVYSLAIGHMGIEIMTKSITIPELVREKEKIANLRKRGIVVIEIIDKESIDTYHELKGIKRLLIKFIEKNNGKWVLTEEDSCGIKTGKYVLTRVYREYRKYKEDEEERYCECCGAKL